jgi:streptogramin lyase
MNLLNAKCAALVAIACCISAGAAHALGLAGTVKEDNGQPVAGVMIKVTSASAAAIVTKVFTDAKGEYLVPDLGKNVGVNSIYVETFKIGYEQTRPQAKTLAVLQPKIDKQSARVDFTLKPVTNIAAQVPSSAWLASSPDSPEKHHTLVTCSQCHQLPSERMRKLAEGLAGQDEAQREQVWRAVTNSMRTAVYGALQSEHSTPLTPEQLAKVVAPEANFINQRDEDIVAPWLAKHMPTNFAQYDIADKNKFADIPLGVTKKTLIREFPIDAYEGGAFVRESAVANGEFWLNDMARNRVGKMNLQTGKPVWYDVPSPGPVAPHTMSVDGEGNLWVTLLGGTGDMAAMLNPKTESWRVYGGFPKSVAAHDFAQASGYRMDADKNNIIWMTLVSHNKVIGFNRTTGEVTPMYDLPIPDMGGTPDHISVYSGGLTSDKNVWFTQNYGDVGRFNTETRKVDYVLNYRGAGPHRLVVGDNDLVYVAVLGAGQISVIDGKQLKEVKRINLPDRASSPYGIIWDKRRNALWLGTVNNDSLFKYDIRSEKFTEYPVGIRDLHMRIVAVDNKTGDLWVASSPIPATDGEVRRVFLYRPGDV